MTQIRYQNYLATIGSKKAMEPIGIQVGIGPSFGFNVIYYDGSNLLVSGDPDKNYRYNLTNERMILLNPRSGVMTPDGILTIETTELLIPLTLGDFSGYKEGMVIANHIYSKTEGGTNTTYRVYINPDSKGDWGTKLKNQSSTMETWLSILSNTLKRNQEVVVAYFKIEKINNDYKVSEIKNPYHYVWGVSDYVTLDRYINDMNNLKSMIPIYEAFNVQLSNIELKVATRDYLNGTVTNRETDTLELDNPSFTLSKLGDVMDVYFGGILNCLTDINLSHQVIIDFKAEMDYVSPMPIETKWQEPMSFDWLTAASEDPESGTRIANGTHTCHGVLGMNENNLSIMMVLLPIKGNQGAVAANLKPRMQFTSRLSLVAQLSEMFEVTLGVESELGTTGTGDVSGAGKYKRGTLVNISASPSDGSGFVGWYDGTSLISADQSYSFEITKSVNFTAMFNGSSSKVQVKATVIPSDKGKVTGTGMYAINTKCTLECTPNTGYGFKQWEMDGKIYTINPLTFGVSKSVEVLCKLITPKRQVNLFSNPSGIFTVQGAGAYEVGLDITVRATLLNSDYKFDGWYFDSYSPANLASNNLVYSFKMPDKNLNLMAHGVYDPYIPPTPTERYTLSTSTNNGGGYVMGGGEYQSGATAVVEAVPYSGYTFSHWSGALSGSSNPNSLTMNSDKSVIANFSGSTPPEPTEKRTLTVNAIGAMTNVSPGIGSFTYDINTVVSVKATPTPGYHLAWGGVSANEKISDTEYRLTMSTNRTVTINSSPDEPAEQTVAVFINTSGNIGKDGGIYTASVGFQGPGSYETSNLTVDTTVGTFTGFDAHGAKISIPANSGPGRDITLTLRSTNTGVIVVGSPSTHTITQAGQGGGAHEVTYMVTISATGVTTNPSITIGSTTLEWTTGNFGQTKEVTLITGSTYNISIWGATIQNLSATGADTVLTNSTSGTITPEDSADGGQIHFVLKP